MESTLHCARCEYDLRMLDPAGVCPECGTSIEKSIAQSMDPLGGARRTIRIGATLILIGLLIRALGFALLAIVMFQKDQITTAGHFILDYLPPVSAATALNATYNLSEGMIAGPVFIAWLFEWIGLALTTRIRLRRRSWFRMGARWGAFFVVFFAIFARGEFGRFGLLYSIARELTFVGADVLVVSYAAMWLQQVLRQVDARKTDWIAAVSVVISSLLAICLIGRNEDATIICAFVVSAAFAWLAVRLRLAACPPVVDVSSPPVAASQV